MTRICSLFIFTSCYSSIMRIESACAWSWAAIDKIGPAPKVSGHSVATTTTTTRSTDYNKEQKRILLFGGLTGSAGSPTTDDLWSYNIASSLWNIEKGTNKGPGRRMYSASAILNDKFYLFGGWDPGEPGSGGKFLDDVWSLDVTSMEWTREDFTLPFPVSRHTTCTVGNKIIIHTFKGVLILEEDAGTVMEQPTSGDVPDGLSMCAVAPLGTDSMLLFAGSTKTQEMSSAAFVLDCKSWTWCKLTNANDDDQCPTARASSCGAALGDDKCIFFGGAGLGEGGYAAGLIPQDETWLVTVVNGKTAQWEKIETDKKPEGRVAASLSDLEDGSFMLQGGWHPVTKETFETPWILKK